MLDPQSSRFWHAALRSGLIDAPGLEACWQAIPPAKRTPDAIDRRLARKTAEAGYLTYWQAQQILGGRSLGFRIDKYLLIDKIGQGGMGRVYLAKDTRLNRQVALKILSPGRMNNPRALARFQREAKVGAQLQHEYLVRIYDEGECNGIRYLVMEYIEGKNAGQLVVENGPMPPAVAARLARQVALGLEHAHQKGLIHRDVNPFNILVTRDGVAKLTDVGLAIDLGDLEEIVTRDGATVGTFDYISPEQARHSRSVDTRSDIYSLGCTLFHLITGRVPFPQSSLPEKLYAHQLSEPEMPSTLVPGVPEGLDEVIRRMMSKSPEARYQSPAAVAEALEPFALGPTFPAGSQSATSTPGLTAGAGTALASPESDQDVHLPPPANEPAHLDFQKVMSVIDFGPDPSLSESLSGDRSRQKSRGDETLRIKLGLIVVAIAIAVLGAIFSVRWGEGAADPTHFPVVVPPGQDDADDLSANPPAPSQPPAISIRWPDGTEKGFASGDALADFKDAIQSAGGKADVEVLLRNREPLVLKVTRPLTWPVGTLVIRAGKNERPIIIADMADNEPFLWARSADCALELEGLTIRAVYPARGQEPPPLIKSAGSLTLKHCALSTSGQAGMTRAISAEGKSITLTKCWFDGFNHTLDLEAHSGGLVRISRCMLIRIGKNVKPSWAITVRRGAGAQRKGRKVNPNLVIDHCTVAGGGLLRSNGFGPMSPLFIEMNDTIVRARALLMWSSPEAHFARVLRWSGQGNCYDISGPAWVIGPPGEPGGEPVALPNSPQDLESWLKVMRNEGKAQAQSIRFAGDSAPADAIGPLDFAPLGPEGLVAGADPDQVGPLSPRESLDRRFSPPRRADGDSTGRCGADASGSRP